MESIEELITRINCNTAAQREQNGKWRQEMGLPDPEPTELDLLLQKWEQARGAPLTPTPEPEGVELPSREPEGVELPSQEPEGVELPSREPEGVEPWLAQEPLAENKREKVEKILPPQPRPQPLKTSPVLPGTFPCPLLLDTLPVCPDHPGLDLEPRSLHHRP
ncbi:UNVERIFIED_CONTAM: hypothetical protein FKN15_003878 [Acipenser sinensis]